MRLCCETGLLAHVCVERFDVMCLTGWPRDLLHRDMTLCSTREALRDQGYIPHVTSLLSRDCHQGVRLYTARLASLSRLEARPGRVPCRARR